MATLRLVASLALITACAPRQPDLYPAYPEPIEVQGPPGGDIDREWQSAAPDTTSGDFGEPSTGAFVDTPASSTTADPVTMACTDGEIDATLAGLGEWVYIEGYGDVWRPYPTTVGANFTPYETCGSWVWTEGGWTFACEWDWGWLPFHYGRWGWFDDYWAWVPGYEWSPAWVEWRGGGGYVGWRPLAPSVRDHRGGGGPNVRDHRGSVAVGGGKGGVRGGSSTGNGAPIVRDHRSSRAPIVRDHRSRVARSNDWQWRFAATEDFGKPRIRAHLDHSLAEGLRVTRPVSRPIVQATVQPVRAASIMRPRAQFTARAVRDHRLAPARVAPRIDQRIAPRADQRVDPRIDQRVDPRVGGRIDGPGDARFGGRSNTGNARFGGRIAPAPQRTVRPASVPDRGSPTRPTWPSQRAEPATFGAAHEPVTPASPEVFTPTTSNPTAPSEPTTQHPLKVPDQYTVSRPPAYAPPQQQPVQQPPRAPDRFGAPSPTTRAPDRVPPPTYAPPRPAAPPTYAPPTYAPPRSSTPTYAPPRSSAPTYAPPSSSAPTYAPPRSSAPTYAPPPGSSAPTYSSPRSSAPTYSPPTSRAPTSGSSAGSFSGARGHRR